MDEQLEKDLVKKLDKYFGNVKKFFLWPCNETGEDKVFIISLRPLKEVKWNWGEDPNGQKT
jgi:hypothetical protein